MRLYSLIITLAISNILFASEPILLTGQNLQIEEVVRAMNDPVQVKIDPSAWERVRRSHALLLQAAREDHPIYGLNRGVGLNKDRTIFQGDTIDPEAREASERFNRNLLYSHSASVEPELSKKIIFPVMLIRLNTLLQGKAGVDPDVITLLAAFINHHIQPAVPSRGSLGEADITILAHIGLAMIGEGEVIFEGRRMPSREALKRVGLQPLVPFGKDGLSILSSNAYSAAMGTILIHHIEKLIDRAEDTFALSLEALNGNVAPFLSDVQILRPYKGQMASAEKIRQALAGSYLWDRSQERALQDPLSFRSASQVHGAVRDLLHSIKAKICIQINRSDDNPAVVLDAVPSADAKEQERAFYVKGIPGAVFPTANFEPINWVIDYEALAIALSHLSHLSTQRMVKLVDERFTKLSRFLSADPQTLAFATIQKTFISLDTEIRTLSSPHSMDYFPVAGDIEDHATNAPLILHRLCSIVSNLNYIFGMELMHAAQAMDLRKQKNPSLRMGHKTKALFEAYRKQISFLKKDRPLTEDIHKSYQFYLSI
ncbi:MAG: aromatic amino acid lyase [Parachlamydia sp.]|nr:aromatic amino acid lyase [Parachlamydia sp.]